MKKIIFITLILLNGNCLLLFAQEGVNKKYYPEQPNYFIPGSHDPSLRVLPEKSFYKSRSDWQYIIDTTWGPGLPLSGKLAIFNTYAQNVRNQFDGFQSLGMNTASWDSLYDHYINKITDSTSRGAFSAIMSRFAHALRDRHTYAGDLGVLESPLNPGIPILFLGSYVTVEHFGAVTTVLPDSTTLVLRVVPNHPLNLEPGDIILGYEGVPWKYLVKELFDAGLPIFSTTGGCPSANTYLNLFGAGMNWHLFDTIDILKYSTGDIVHLSVLPMLNLNVPAMVNNEQISIPNIPFPDVLANQCVTYGILDETNIGYIYIAQEWPTSTADAQLFEAVNSLKNTDALIIDMRFNLGGWAFFTNAFNILFNDFYSAVEDAYRCNVNTFDLCPSGNWQTFRVGGNPPLYDRPISVLLGPTCHSMGDITAQRLRYHPMVRFFGKSPNASLGDNVIVNVQDWAIRYSISDMFHKSDPGVYLNRREFPIDFPVWHNADDVAIGRDAVVEEALNWINNLIFPHNTTTDKCYYLPAIESVQLSTVIENPNSHQISARAYLKTIEDVLIDSVNLAQQTQQSASEVWAAEINLPLEEEFYKINLTAFDETTLTSFSVPNTTRFSTAGPVVLDSISYTQTQNQYSVKTFLKNESADKTITNATVKLICNDSWVLSITPNVRTLPDISPGEVVSNSSSFNVSYIDSLFPGYFNFKVEVMSHSWLYWKDSMYVVVTSIDDKIQLPHIFTLHQNYPNPFNPSTTISWQSPVSGYQVLKVFDVLGNEVATLVDEFKPVGRYEVEFDASHLSSGVYLYKLTAGEYTSTKKLMLLK